MKHCGTKLLETDRPVLQRFTVEDAAAMYRNRASDKEVTRYLTWPTHDNVETSSAVLICRTETRMSRSGAFQAVIDYMFDEAKVIRIESRHDPRNPHFGMVMKKCGLKYEGTLRCADRNNQGICAAFKDILRKVYFCTVYPGWL